MLFFKVNGVSLIELGLRVELLKRISSSFCRSFQSTAFGVDLLGRVYAARYGIVLIDDPSH